MRQGFTWTKPLKCAELGLKDANVDVNTVCSQAAQFSITSRTHSYLAHIPNFLEWLLAGVALVLTFVGTGTSSGAGGPVICNLRTALEGGEQGLGWERASER